MIPQQTLKSGMNNFKRSSTNRKQMLTRYDSKLRHQSAKHVQFNRDFKKLEHIKDALYSGTDQNSVTSRNHI